MLNEGAGRGRKYFPHVYWRPSRRFRCAMQGKNKWGKSKVPWLSSLPPPPVLTPAADEWLQFCLCILRNFPSSSSVSTSSLLQFYISPHTLCYRNTDRQQAALKTGSSCSWRDSRLCGGLDFVEHPEVFLSQRFACLSLGRDS